LSASKSTEIRFSEIFSLAVLNIKIRYKSTQLGLVWTALEPLLYFTVLYVVFTSIRARSEDFAIYLITGILLFHIFSRGTSGGLISLTGNRGLIISLNIKRVVFPMIATVGTFILAIVDVGVFFGLMPAFSFTPHWTLILIPIPIGLLFLLVLGLSYWLSITNVFFRDIQYVWLIISQSLFFISPIFWRLEDVSGILLEIQKINPLGQLIEISHQLVINGEIPQAFDWLYTTSFVLVILFSGYFVFKKFQNRIAEEL